MVKGTAELICLHGLNDLDNDTYLRVIRETDILEHEPWMLQSGGELWRRVLNLLPERQSVPHALMHMARLPAESLESLMLDVIERPELARPRLAQLG